MIGDHVGPAAFHYCHGMATPTESTLRFSDDVGNAVYLDDTEVLAIWNTGEGIDAATVSACVSCKCRVVSTLALADLLSDALALATSHELYELVDDAVSAHLYVVDLATKCLHRTWLDPLAEAWAEVVQGPRRRAIR